MTRSEHPSDPLREQMHDLLDGRLSNADAESVRAKIAADENLTREYGELSQLVDDLSALREDSAPHRLRDSVIRAVSAESTSRTRGPRRSLRVVLPIAAAALLSATALLIHRTSAPSAPETARESDIARLEHKDEDFRRMDSESRDSSRSNDSAPPAQPVEGAKFTGRDGDVAEKAPKERATGIDAKRDRGDPSHDEPRSATARGAGGGGGAGPVLPESGKSASDKDTKFGAHPGQKPGKNKSGAATGSPGAEIPTGGMPPKAPGVKSAAPAGAVAAPGKPEEASASDKREATAAGGELKAVRPNGEKGGIDGSTASAGTGAPRLLRLRATANHTSPESASASDDRRIGGLLKTKDDLARVITNDAEIERAIAALPEAAREAVVAARKRAPNRVHLVSLTEAESDTLIANAKKAHREVDEFVAGEPKRDDVSKPTLLDSGEQAGAPVWRSLGESTKKSGGDAGSTVGPATGGGKKAGETKGRAVDTATKEASTPAKAAASTAPTRRLVIVIDES